MPRTKKQKAVDLNAFSRNWKWLLALGILFILMGTLGLGMVVYLTLASMFFLGVILIIAGGSQVIDVFKSKQWRGVVIHAIIALFYIVGGLLIIYDPVLASSVITAGLAGILIIIGAARLFMASILSEGNGWIWMLLSGIAAIVLGILILAHWPVSGLWFIGLMVAIELIIAGWTYVFFAFSLRQ